VCLRDRSDDAACISNSQRHNVMRNRIAEHGTYRFFASPLPGDFAADSSFFR
jgi:hypothetical protein